MSSTVGYSSSHLPVRLRTGVAEALCICRTPSNRQAHRKLSVTAQTDNSKDDHASNQASRTGGCNFDRYDKMRLTGCQAGSDRLHTYQISTHDLIQHHSQLRSCIRNCAGFRGSSALRGARERNPHLGGFLTKIEIKARFFGGGCVRYTCMLSATDPEVYSRIIEFGIS